MVFNDQFAVNVSIVRMASGRHHVWGMVYDCRNGGPAEYDLIEQAEMRSVLDEHHQAQSQQVSLTTVSGRRYQLNGTALALIPLRNRRQTDSGEWRSTRITEADWRLFTTLVRFDAVYFAHFKCNRRRIRDYPNLSNYVRDLYQQEGIAEDVNFEHIKRHYYYSHPSINPSRIVPLGPELNFNEPHNRARFNLGGRRS